MNPEMTMVMRRNEEREALKSIIQQWNANRLDLFELSEPNENLEFHGVMRFYFQDSGQKVATKCIRVASDATAQDVVETLIEKFRPDMRMLSLPEYALFEIHENGEERKLAMDEKPLLVQLNWHKDDREGRFLLRRLDDKTNMPSNTFQQDGSSFRRKLSKREKKQLKKQEKLNRLKSSGAIDENDAPKVAEKLYSELPETSFTRSISNPEAVMRRRRQRELERKLQQFRSKDGGPDTGGTLKIYGESLCRDVPYKTLLLSIRDNAQQVVKEMLIKYGLEKEDPHNYCLIQVNGYNEYSKENHNQNNLNNNNNMLNCQEYILDDDECPLAILMSHSQSQGSIMFHVRRRPADYHPRKRKKKPQHKWNQHQSSSNELLEYRYEDGLDRLPLFLELNPDGTEINGGAAKRHRLHPNVTEVGCERKTSQSQSQYMQLFGPNILPRHCVIANTEGIVTVTPCSRDSETYVNGQRIYETTILRNGSIVKFGRIHCFRFLDPRFEELRQRQDSLRNAHEFSTYDRQSTKDDSSSQIPTPQTSKEDSRSQRSIGSNSNDGNRISNPAYHRQGTDAILPAVLEIKEETEETLLNEIITSLDPNSPSFKLAPAYCLYLMARYRASTHYRPELTPTERAHRLTLMLARVASIIQKVIQERYCDVRSLALWLANSSELLFFLQFDRHLHAFSKDARRMLAESVQISFRHLVGCVQSELSSVMPLFFADKDDTSHESEETPSVLAVLSSAMSLLRRYRVNVALTVQLFSHLFHFINVWAFNRLIAPNTNYCSRLWGMRLKSRLAHIEAWAERQGLEISTDTHLAKIKQAAHLLQAPKNTTDDLRSLSSLCFLLNSLQLRALLLKYQPASDEPTLPREHLENVVKVAEDLADELARSDGREVKLEEDPEFALEFVLPIDSYSCEVVRGIPPGLVEFVAPLQSMGLCRLSTQPTSNGLWTVYMELPNVKGAMIRSPSAMSNRSVGYLPGPQEPEIQTIKLHKSNNGMGLSIVAAKGAGQNNLGIYIKSVVKGGAADIDGRLVAGDQLLKVDDQSLVGITQEKAAEYLVRTGPIVTLEVAKQGAIYHGLATLLSQPSPVMTRDPERRRSEMFPQTFQRVAPNSVSMINLTARANYEDGECRRSDWDDVGSAGGRRMSERDLPSRVMNEPPTQNPQLPIHAPIHSSKSVPSLNSPCGPDGQIVSPMASRSSHEVFNATYNSTASSNGIHQSHPGLRSRSSQNLNDSRSLNNYPATISGSLPNRQPSNPNLLNNASSQYGQHYGQMPPHQQQQHPMYHQHVQQQQMLMYQQQQQQQQQQQYLYSQHNQSSDNGERFYQNLNVYRNQELQNGSLHENSMNSSVKGKILSPQQERAANQFQRSFRGSQTSLVQQPQGRPSTESLSAYMKERPSSAYLPIQKENYPPSTMNISNRSQSARDMLRQEAKLQEMTEEVRRREMRSNYSPQQQHYPGSPSRTLQPTNENVEGTVPGYHQRPNPGQVMYVDGQPMRPPYPSHKNGLMRPTLEEIGYRESPPPPPPPPTSTHPLYQTSNSQRSPENRYNASVGEPPKGGYYPSSPATSTSKYHTLGTNPWEREEREKEAERRREAVKEWRDQQISELLSLGPNRNQLQEEQLRSLKLDKEFERRAEEEDDDEDEDQEATERVQDLMRAAREQDELKGSSSKAATYSPHAPPTRWNNPQAQSHTNGTAGRFQTPQNVIEEKERLRRMKDMKMKQVELEAAKAEESRLKCKDEEPNTFVNGHHTSNVATTKTLSRPTHLRLDTSTASILNQSAAAAAAGYGDAEHSGDHGSGVDQSAYGGAGDYSSAAAPQQRLDNLLDYSNNAPPPPERGSSFAVMSQTYRSPAVAAAAASPSTPSQNYSAKHDTPVSATNSTKKVVSFQETTREIPPPSTPVEKVLEDPNRFISEAESMLASPKSPDTQFINATPGVIGTQEVYKDPRQRRLAEQQHQKLLSNKVVPVPEKLTFKEKMKMFAMETGEEGTPKDKVKISRAQRDIDNLNSPSTPATTTAAAP